jgi:threonine dehydratase
MGRSLRAGRILPVDEPAPPTRCDALQTKLVSPLTFGALSDSGAEGASVGDAEIEAAMRFAFAALKLVVEPGGAVALAAWLAGKTPFASDVGGDVVVVVSGGNVDPQLYADILAGSAS